MPDTERELVSRATRGDATAVDELLERHLPALHAFVRLRLGGVVALRESSADIVQSVCREVLQDVSDFDYTNSAHFRNWLFTTAMRKITDRHRYYHRERRDAAREVRQPTVDGGHELLGHYATLHTPSQDAVAADVARQIERAFDRLTEEQREVITLSRIVGLSNAEIAAQTGKTDGAVRVTLHRGLARLATLIES